MNIILAICLYYDTLSHMNVNKKIQDEKIKFRTYLDNMGLRMSPARKRVFEKVMQLHGHFSAEFLASACQEGTQKVSRATVYRTLKELLESGVIRETAFGDKHQNYEHLYDEKPHHHARCSRCGTFVELPDLNEDKLYESILKEKGFQMLGHEMHFYGICAECQ